MKVSKRVIEQELQRYARGEWRLVKLNQEKDGSLWSDPFPDGPWTVEEIRRDPVGQLWVYLIRDENADDVYQGIWFTPENAKNLLDNYPLPWKMKL